MKILVTVLISITSFYVGMVLCELGTGQWIPQDKGILVSALQPLSFVIGVVFAIFPVMFIAYRHFRNL